MKVAYRSLRRSSSKGDWPSWVCNARTTPEIGFLIKSPACSDHSDNWRLTLASTMAFGKTFVGSAERGAAFPAEKTESGSFGGTFPPGRLEEIPGDGGGMVVVDISPGIHDARY